jgi:hypothetical protein
LARAWPTNYYLPLEAIHAFAGAFCAFIMQIASPAHPLLHLLSASRTVMSHRPLGTKEAEWFSFICFYPVICPVIADSQRPKMHLPFSMHCYWYYTFVFVFSAFVGLQYYHLFLSFR